MSFLMNKVQEYVKLYHPLPIGQILRSGPELPSLHDFYRDFGASPRQSDCLRALLERICSRMLFRKELGAFACGTEVILYWSMDFFCSLKKFCVLRYLCTRYLRCPRTPSEKKARQLCTASARSITKHLVCGMREKISPEAKADGSKVVMVDVYSRV